VDPVALAAGGRRRVAFVQRHAAACLPQALSEAQAAEAAADHHYVHPVLLELYQAKPHPAGGRALQVEMTAAGERSLEAAHAAMGPVEARMLSDLSQSEREQLRGLLERCLASLRGT
jgi:hypothetical protein